MTSEIEKLDVTVYWRPGCGFCQILRRELDRAGLERTEVNIWEDPEGAELVRSVAWGNETVPTVVIGDKALVNPSAREVLALAGAPAGIGTAPAGTGRRLTAIADSGWSLAAGVGWLILALTHPTTTYHLAPLLTAVAWPLTVARRPASRGSRDGLRAVTGGALLAGLVLGVLALAGALDGPALIGSTAARESLIVIAVGTLIGSAVVRPRGGSSPSRGSETRTLESVPGSGGGCTDEACDLPAPDLTS
ncbi:MULTISPECIES: glutaredoxin domain-containing protein [unclassified Nocardioides]|uniref:glutaredoxin domain-containing protein n=1 Tax=unclassified Nocardioides TaxID=2615069 RepID=UPI0009F158CA|nr:MULTISPECIES: glutaredoxin domain-containing protein [unclassified Nocardioides]GAW49219.1 Glutaredoxin [Nocardioides sp. PD653-B2]GAW55707.1 Glutaredoxin [Nocardioides sp. PD653]